MSKPSEKSSMDQAPQGQFSPNEGKKKGMFSRAFTFMREKLQERAAPAIPEEDRRINEELRARIVNTPEYQN